MNIIIMIRDWLGGSDSLLQSDFDEKEEFEFDNVPKQFRSVTEDSLKRTKRVCLKAVGRRYHGEYNPRALKAMLLSVDGAFEPAYEMLEGDYNAQRTNLTQAYQSGLADVEEQWQKFKNEAMKHNELFRLYQEEHREIFGRELSEELLFSNEQLKELEKQYAELKGVK